MVITCASFFTTGTDDDVRKWSIYWLFCDFSFVNDASLLLLGFAGQQFTFQFSFTDATAVQKEREERVRRIRELQEEERLKKIEELKQHVRVYSSCVT